MKMEIPHDVVYTSFNNNSLFDIKIKKNNFQKEIIFKY